jgi:hypothetical protein
MSQRQDHGGGCVGAIVVDHQDFVANAERIKHLTDLVDEATDVFRLAQRGNYEGEFVRSAPESAGRGRFNLNPPIDQHGC